MLALVALPVKYSTAYSTGRERFLEPQNGCDGEASLRREAARSASEGPARGRARAYAQVACEHFCDRVKSMRAQRNLFVSATISGCDTKEV